MTNLDLLKQFDSQQMAEFLAGDRTNMIRHIFPGGVVPEGIQKAVTVVIRDWLESEVEQDGGTKDAGENNNR